MLKIENWIKIWEVKPQKEGMKRETHIQKKISEESVRNTTDSLNLIDMQIVPGLMGVFSWQGWRDRSKLPRESTIFPAASLPEKLCSLPFLLHRYSIHLVKIIFTRVCVCVCVYRDCFVFFSGRFADFQGYLVWSKLTTLGLGFVFVGRNASVFDWIGLGALFCLF
jgi:hypothetical protein